MPGQFFKGAGPWRGRHISYDGFEPSKTGIAACAVGPEIRSAVGSIAREATMYAQLIAPSDTRGYQSGFRTEVQIVPDIPFRVRGFPMRRWSGEVVNTDPSAIWVELAQGGDGHRVMRRTLEWIESVAD